MTEANYALANATAEERETLEGKINKTQELFDKTLDEFYEAQAVQDVKAMSHASKKLIGIGEFLELLLVSQEEHYSHLSREELDKAVAEFNEEHPAEGGYRRRKSRKSRKSKKSRKIRKSRKSSRNHK